MRATSGTAVRPADLAGAPSAFVPEAGTRQKRVTGKRVVLLLCVVAGLAAAGLYGWQWYSVGRFFEDTDDAFVSADAVALAPQVSGLVTAVSVADNQTVRAGQVLARIDDRDYRAAVAQGEAEIAEAQAGQAASAAQITEQQAQIAQAQADIESDQAQLQFAALEQQRASRLSVTGSGTAQAVDRTQAQVRQDLAALKHAQAALRSSLAKIESFKAGIAFAEANLLKAQADTERARLNLEHTVLTAPIDGIVGDRSLRPGLYVRPGVGLLTIVPSGQALYVTANFKETQLHHMQPGQMASFTADAFGDHVFRGHVDSISPGTGAEFSLLPPENATGNFTKIVQRVPVKIRLDGTDPWTSRLRSGLSVAVSIDTRHDRLAGGRG